MRPYILFLLFVRFNCIASSQPIVTKKDIIYGTAVNLHNKSVDLRLDITYPSGGKKLPLIVCLHGGGFMEGSSKQTHLPFCEGIAKNGFVVANVEYRRGFSIWGGDLKNEVSKAVYRAEQDELAAVRYLVHHSSEYLIDPDAVFIAGESAGGVSSLFTAYVSQDDWDHAMPNFHKELGAIANSGNEFREKFDIKGVISMWGGIADTSFISPGEAQAVPALLFHSMGDAEIPIERSTHPEARQQQLEGSLDIAHRFKSCNACCHFYFVKQAAHGYGFSSDYIAAAITTFIKSIQSHKCTSVQAENKSSNISLSFMDMDEDAFPNEEYRIIKLSPDVLQQYAGKYEIRGGVITVSVDGDHLRAQASGGAPNEIYPIAKDIFVHLKNNHRVEFVRDSTGKVIEHIVRFTKKREAHFRRLQ